MIFYQIGFHVVPQRSQKIHRKRVSCKCPTSKIKLQPKKLDRLKCFPQSADPTGNFKIYGAPKNTAYPSLNKV